MLAQSAIDPAIIDLGDETGRASVAVTIPTATPAGTLVLTVAVPQTGTAIDVPLTITAGHNLGYRSRDQWNRDGGPHSHSVSWHLECHLSENRLPVESSGSTH